MAKKLTPKQKGFVRDYLQTGNATQAVMRNYNVDKPEVAASIGSENLRKPNIMGYIEDKSERAAEIIYDIAENGEGDVVRLNASKDILDRAGYKPTEKTLNLNLNAEIEIREELKDLANGLLERQRQ